MKSVSKYRIWRFTIGQYDTTVFPQNGHIPVAKQQYLSDQLSDFLFLSLLPCVCSADFLHKWYV